MEWMTSAQAREMLEVALAGERKQKVADAFRLVLQQRPGLVALEEVVQKLMGRSGATILELEMQAIADSLDTDREPRRCPNCGKMADFKSRRSRELESSIGPLQFFRHIHHCLCGSTFGPADAAIGIKPGTHLSPRMRALTEKFGREAGSFKLARELMAETVTSAAASTIGLVIARNGEEAIARDRQQVKEVRRAPRNAPLVPDPATRDDTLIIECDGGAGPCRPKDGERRRADAGTHRDDDASHVSEAGRSPRPRTTHREMKIGAIYMQRDRIEKPSASPDQPPRGQIVRSFMQSWIGHWTEFGRLLWTLAITVGLRSAKRVVLIGDGSKWIDDLQREFFPRAIRILDFWHAIEHLAKVGRVALGDSPPFQKWLAQQRHRLRHGHLDAVLAAVRSLETHRAKGLKKAIRDTLGYLEPRRQQMDYPRFVALGLPIGSGLIEGRIKNEKRRVDSSGMRWDVANLQAMLTLRAHAHNQKATARRAA